MQFKILYGEIEQKKNKRGYSWNICSFLILVQMKLISCLYKKNKGEQRLEGIKESKIYE